MTWVDLSSAFGYGTKLTSTQMQNLRDNITALANGDSGHPEIVQAALKTTMSGVSGVGNSTLPGGEYGFYPQVKRSGGTLYTVQIASSATNTSYATNVHLSDSGTGSTPYAQQRYIQSSGEIYWIFILRNKSTKEILRMWRAPDHPCFGNGAKPDLLPHPFVDYDPDTETVPEYDASGEIIGTIPAEVICINPDAALVEEIQKKTIIPDSKTSNKDFLEILIEEYEIDELSQPAWPTEEITVGLPPDWEDNSQPVKMQIPQPDCVLCRSLKLKTGVIEP